MATSLLRLGRLGSLKDGWGSLRTPLTAAFCTKTAAPKKPAKKATTLEAPDERAALLAYKTTVAFPTRLSTPGFLTQGVALGEYEQSGDPVTNESAVAAGAAGAEPAPASGDVEAPKSEVAPKDDDATSSSSSSSDSDSDSDSDDEKPDKTEMAKPVIQTEDKAGQKGMPSAGSEEPTSDVKTGAVPEHVQPSVPGEAIKGAPKGAIKGAPEVAEAVSERTSKEVPAPSTAEEIADPAPVLCTAENVKARAEVLPEKQAGVEVKSSEVSDAIAKGAPKVAAEPTPGVVLDSATKVASEPEVESKAAPETTEAVVGAEELSDPAPSITDAEEVRAEPEVAAAPEEAAASPKPEPEPEPEPFNNTTYKNLQHHGYNIYTFVDMDVEMANHRLPQPSTGRPSPRH